MGAQGFFGGGGQAQGRASTLAALLGEKMPGQRHDVVRALAQCGNQQRENVESVIDVLAQHPAGNRFGHVTVGGGDQADVERDRLFAAHPFHLALLQDA